MVAETKFEEGKNAHLGELKIFKDKLVGMDKQLLDLKTEDLEYVDFNNVTDQLEILHFKHSSSLWWVETWS